MTTIAIASASPSSETPFGDRYCTDVAEIGPLRVMWCDDGSVWARGLAPLHQLVRLDEREGTMRLVDFAQACTRIDSCTAQGALEQLRVELLHLYKGELYAPYLAQWMDHRVRVIAQGAGR